MKRISTFYKEASVFMFPESCRWRRKGRMKGEGEGKGGGERGG